MDFSSSSSSSSSLANPFSALQELSDSAPLFKKIYEKVLVEVKTNGDHTHLNLFLKKIMEQTALSSDIHENRFLYQLIQISWDIPGKQSELVTNALFKLWKLGIYTLLSKEIEEDAISFNFSDKEPVKINKFLFSTFFPTSKAHFLLKKNINVGNLSQKAFLALKMLLDNQMVAEPPELTIKEMYVFCEFVHRSADDTLKQIVKQFATNQIKQASADIKDQLMSPEAPEDLKPMINRKVAELETEFAQNNPDKYQLLVNSSSDYFIEGSSSVFLNLESFPLFAEHEEFSHFIKGFKLSSEKDVAIIPLLGIYPIPPQLSRLVVSYQNEFSAFPDPLAARFERIDLTCNYSFDDLLAVLARFQNCSNLQLVYASGMAKNGFFSCSSIQKILSIQFAITFYLEEINIEIPWFLISEDLEALKKCKMLSLYDIHFYFENKHTIIKLTKKA